MGARLQRRKRGWKLWETQFLCTRDGMLFGTSDLERSSMIRKNRRLLEIIMGMGVAGL